MKKVLLLLLVLSVVTFAFGQEQQANNFNFGLTCLIAVSDGMWAPGPGVAVSWNRTSLFGPVGMGAYLHLVLPLVSVEEMGETTINPGIAASLLAGPSFLIFDNSTFALPITVGIHFTAVTIGPLFAINLGIGAAADLLWRFGQEWHGYTRLMLAYNFRAGGEFLVFPGFGVGFSF